jgi:hypothetical protein
MTPIESAQPDWLAFEWCVEQFGPVNPRNTRWYYGNCVFFFRDSADALLFALRWSE